MTLESAKKCWEDCQKDENFRNTLLSLDEDGRERKVREMGYDFTLHEMMEALGAKSRFSM